MSRVFDIMMGKISISDKPPTPPEPIRRPAAPRAAARTKPMATLEWEDLLKIKMSRGATICGVYFLFQGNRIVYVGQSRNIHVRIENHRRDKSKRFDGYAFVECRPAKLGVLEATYIAKFSPKYNSVRHASRLYMTGDCQDMTESVSSELETSKDQQLTG